MRRLFMLIIAVLVAGWSAATAQPPPVPKEGSWIVPLIVYPVAEPKPALKYLLLPEARDMNPGNQIPAFYKCFMEQHNFYRSKESIDQREIWVKTSLSELAQVKALIGYGGASTARRISLPGWKPWTGRSCLNSRWKASPSFCRMSSNSANWHRF